jgi:hypothetical protein
VLATRARDYIQGLSAARYVGPPDSPEAQRGMLDWVRVFAAAAVRAADDAEQFGQRIAALAEAWRERAAPIRRNSATDLLLRALPAAPIITVATAATLIGRSIQATNEAVNRLVVAGVLVPTRPVRWNRAFEALGLLDMLTLFERSLASPTGDTHESPPVRRVPYRPAKR